MAVEANEGGGPQVRVRIVIDLLSDGRIGVQHPEDKILACGMLELAKQVIVQAKVEEKRIVPGVMVPFMPRQ